MDENSVQLGASGAGGAAAGHGWHTSYWPLVVSVGVLFLVPLSFMSWAVYKSAAMTFISLGIGVPLTFIAIAGWVKEGIEDKYGYGAGHSVWAMPLFIAAEALIFVGFFAAYWALRLGAANWPPAGTPEKGFTIPIIMTIILVASSVTIHLAESQIEREEPDRGSFILWLVVTMALGAVFLGMTVFEWNTLFHEGFNLSTNIYSTAFYSITGFHASHVLVGLGIFLCVLIPAIGGKVNHSFVKAASMYWHFVDVVWFFVVSQVYFW